MSFFTKNRIRSWLLIFLLVTNVATISTIVYHSWRFRRMESTDTHARLRELIDNDLKLSVEQTTKYKTEKKLIQSKTETYYENFEMQRMSIYNELAKKDIDTVIIDSIIIQTGITSAEINKMSILQYYSLFKICNAQQKEILGKFFKDMANDIAIEIKEEKNNNETE